MTLLYSAALTFLFQSTRSARSATNGQEVQIVFQIISIHALREERDPPSWMGIGMTGGHFNPRAPRGARRKTFSVVQL